MKIIAQTVKLLDNKVVNSLGYRSLFVKINSYDCISL